MPAHPDMKLITGTPPLRLKAAIAATVLGLWLSLVLLFGAPLALRGGFSWFSALSFAASFWAPWLLFLPAVAWLSFRFPIERRRLLRNVLLHLFACLIVIGTSRAILGLFEDVLPWAQRSEPPRRSPEWKPGRMGSPGVSALRVYFRLRAALDVLVYSALVGVCQAITNFRSSQERERRAAELEASLTRAKLQALRMQINPHFLFNTLNSITALVYVNPRAADEMLGDLSELLRRSIESMDEQEIPLAEELEFIGAYLSIEQKRFGDRLRLEQHVPADLMQALVPTLILQPLVENAIRHGIEPQRDPGLITIEAKREGKQLHLIVRDEGRGATDLDGTNSERRGIGLPNTRARLLALYGRDQTFSFGRTEPQGFRAEIRIPFHLDPVQVPDVFNKPAT
jgi:two-component system LytT family sensor kinase